MSTKNSTCPGAQSILLPCIFSCQDTEAFLILCLIISLLKVTAILTSWITFVGFKMLCAGNYLLLPFASGFFSYIALMRESFMTWYVAMTPSFALLYYILLYAKNHHIILYSVDGYLWAFHSLFDYYK
jgi:hypothetical protein